MHGRMVEPPIHEEVRAGGELHEKVADPQSHADVEAVCCAAAYIHSESEERNGLPRNSPIQAGCRLGKPYGTVTFSELHEAQPGLRILTAPGL